MYLRARIFSPFPFAAAFETSLCLLINFKTLNPRNI